MAGHLTRDVEMRYTIDNTAIANFGIAVNHGWKSKDGTDKKEVCFVDVAMFGKRAEALEKYFKKGDAILIKGRLKFDQWEKDNQKRSKHSIGADDFQFVGGKQDTAEKTFAKNDENIPF